MGSSKSKATPDRPAAKQAANLAKLEAHVAKVHISGLMRTHDDYIRKSISNLFRVKTFEELLQETVHTRGNLTELGIFKSVNVTIDVAKDNPSDKSYEVTFDGVEHSRVTGSVGTEIGQNEGAATVEIAAPNLLGRGERFSVHGSYGNTKSTDINIKLIKPFYHTILGDYKPELSMTIFRNSSQYTWSKYRLTDTGMLLEWSLLMPQFISHSFQYECSIKEVMTLEKQVPFFVRENSGPRFASLFRHVCVYDDRDNSVLPTDGVQIKSTIESCGYGGDISYLKGNFHVERNFPLFAGMSLQLCSRIGTIRSTNGTQIPIHSKFFIGGPFTIRGFRTGGAGTQTEGAATGNHTYWLTGAHLWTPLPFNRYFGMLGNHLKVHLFANAGNVDSFETDTCRTSIGAGLAFRLGERARIEMNYCKPVHKQPTDFALKEGFQFGIGYEFL